MLPNHCSHAHPRMNRPRNGRPARPAAALALLAFALLVAPHAARAQVQPQGAAVVSPPEAPELKVLTWNIRGGKANPQTGAVEGSCQPNTSDDYLNDIVREIRSHAGLDVVALQEVYRSQAFKLRQKLTGHLGNAPDLHFVPTMGCLRLDNDRPGIALISRYKFAAGSEDNVALCRHVLHPHNPFRRPAPPAKPRCPTRETRQLALARIVVEGRPVHLYTTHLALGAGIQDDMAEVIVEKLESDRRAAGSTFRPVLMGDFNAKRFIDPAYNTIRSAGYLDAWLGVNHDSGDCDANSYTFLTWDRKARIDYVFYGRPFTVVGARVSCVGTIRDTFGLDDNWEINGEKRLDQVPDHLPLTVRLAF